MSSTTTGTDKPSPATSGSPKAEPPVSHAEPTAAAANPFAPKANELPGEDGDLQKLLVHMQGLQNQNTEMVEVLESLAAAKASELEQILNDRIMPWITSLNIPPELREKVISGIKTACLKPSDRKNYRNMLDLDTNPVMQVMCAAAQAHGEAIRQVEETRKQLHDASSTAERISRDKIMLDARLDATTNRLTHARAAASSVGDKRPIDEVDADSDVNSKCWAHLFESFA